jgi:hypothetical protein
MATNFNVGIIDFSKLFIPLSKGGTAYPTATGYKLSNGQDLNEVFAALGTVNALGTGLVAAKTGFLLSDGVTDLADIFNGGQTIITFNANVVKTSPVGYLYDFYTVKTTTAAATITIRTDYAKTFYYMAVAGGGGGSQRGGGGGGGMLDGSFTIGNETITINVGTGGIGSSTTAGTNGSNTRVVFSNNPVMNITCIGGGGGSYLYENGGVGRNGGSGGGGSGDGVGGAGTAGQGNKGGNGNGFANNFGNGGGGGGGGAGGEGGASGSSISGKLNGVGGIGRYSDYSGTGLGYAGGGSESYVTVIMSPNTYGGGSGTSGGRNGLANRGGGAGGSNGNGGSGIFVLAVLR